jgi:hypothetical protein
MPENQELRFMPLLPSAVRQCTRVEYRGEFDVAREFPGFFFPGICD